MVTIETRRMSVETFDEWVMLPENHDQLFEYIGGEITEMVFKGEKKRIEVYAPGQPVKILGTDDTLDGSAVLPGFTLALREIFPMETSEQ